MSSIRGDGGGVAPLVSTAQDEVSRRMDSTRQASATLQRDGANAICMRAFVASQLSTGSRAGIGIASGAGWRHATNDKRRLARRFSVTAAFGL